MGDSGRLWRRLLTSAAWDGLLPVFVVSIPFAIRLFWQQNEIFVALATFVVPVCAAMFRAAIAHDELVRICSGSVSYTRQAGISLAIILLLLCEIAVGALSQMNDEPVRAWIIPVGFYSVYLVTITATLSPPATTSIDPETIGVNTY